MYYGVPSEQLDDVLLCSRRFVRNDMLDDSIALWDMNIVGAGDPLSHDLLLSVYLNSSTLKAVLCKH